MPQEQAAAIQINGLNEPLSATTLTGLLEAKELPVTGRGIAVALNGAVVPRAAWPVTSLKAGDVIEIVRAQQGG